MVEYKRWQNKRILQYVLVYTNENEQYYNI